MNKRVLVNLMIKILEIASMELVQISILNALQWIELNMTPHLSKVHLPILVC